MNKRYRLKTIAKSSGKEFLSPLVYTDEQALDLMERFESWNKGTAIELVSTIYYPEGCEWEETMADIDITPFAEMIEVREELWEVGE